VILPRVAKASFPRLDKDTLVFSGAISLAIVSNDTDDLSGNKACVQATVGLRHASTAESAYGPRDRVQGRVFKALLAEILSSPSEINTVISVPLTYKGLAA
jgi:hypothetical protein